MPERCNCGARGQQTKDSMGRAKRSFECGAVWLEPTPNQALEIKECPKYRSAMESLKQWVDSLRC